MRWSLAGKVSVRFALALGIVTPNGVVTLTSIRYLTTTDRAVRAAAPNSSST